MTTEKRNMPRKRNRKNKRAEVYALKRRIKDLEEENTLLSGENDFLTLDVLYLSHRLKKLKESEPKCMD